MYDILSEDKWFQAVQDQGWCKHIKEDVVKWIAVVKLQDYMNKLRMIH